MPRKQKINDSVIQEAHELAKAGFNDKQIQEALKISKSLMYANLEFMDTIKEARKELRHEISKSLMNNAVNLDNPTVQIFLAKKLRLFDDTFDSINLKNSDDVLKVISSIFKAVSDGSISDDKANQLKSLLDTFTKAYEVNELDKRITLLEES
jgi:ribosomal protein S20